MTQKVRRASLAATVFISIFSVLERASAFSNRLPVPSGKFGVAHVAFDWVDSSRPETASTTTGARPELMVYVWYPTEKKSETARAAYLPGAESIAKSMENHDIKQLWGNAWPAIESGQIVGETYDGTRVASGTEKFPLLVFSPGLGVPGTTYTSLIQQLVSRGYIVASIEPTYEVAAVAFPDGRVIVSSPQAMGHNLPSPPDDTKENFLSRMHEFDASHINKWAADVRFVIDRVAALNETAGKDRAPFSDRVDLSNVAAWGHSFGGRAAARVCQLDSRIRACLNADGLGPDGPIFTCNGESLPAQPFMWIEVFHEPPTDAQLAPYKMTRKDWEKDHQAQLATNNQQLKDCPGGSYHVSINLPGIEHFSFSDKPLVEAAATEDARNATQALTVIEDYVSAFFDKHLKRAGDTLLDQAHGSSGVSVEKFGGLPSNDGAHD